jgi:hypothetical protein
MTTDPTAAIALTTPVVEQWLKLVDDGRYAESWHSFSVTSKQALSSQQWVDLVAKTRTLFGEPHHRTFVFAKFSNDLGKLVGVTIPGEFVEFFFDSSYERLPAARERILVTLDPDGQWRISTYVVKPR